MNLKKKIYILNNFLSDINQGINSKIKIKILRACLVYYNGYYNVIRTRITRNKRSCNGISIHIHRFGYNKLVR